MIFFGDIKPNGWLKRHIQKYMDGNIGELDKLVPHLILQHDIYGKDRISYNSKPADLGIVTTDTGPGDNELQYYWWNSETQSNWRDGFCRSAYLLDEEQWIRKARNFYLDFLEKQDKKDGYIGIYAPDLRFHCDCENGELWAQATALRCLLGCYEASRDSHLIQSIKHAAQCIMSGYPKENSHPFCVRDGFSGHSHGLCITDVFYRLYELTNDRDYLSYCTWLYSDYCSGVVSEKDLQLKNIVDPHYLFTGHGVHTYEHIRALVIASIEDSQYDEALKILLCKLKYYLTPSGAPIGDEWIAKRTANASSTGYEYCSLHELLSTYILLLKIKRKMHFADDAEWLFYNASFGMRHPSQHSIMYCKTDNSYEANGKKSPDSRDVNLRYMFSPTHDKSAVCCVPNSGRTIPLFVENMFHETETGLIANFYGSCIFNTTYNDIAIKITETGSFPFNLHLQIIIETEHNVEFTLGLRFPSWAKGMQVNDRYYSPQDAKDSVVALHQVWHKYEVIEINFDTEIIFRTDLCGDYYISRGPLLYAIEIESVEHIKDSFLGGKYKETCYTPHERKWERLEIDPNDFSSFVFTQSHGDEGYITGLFSLDGRKIIKKLVPFGHTLLRKVTFPNIHS